LPPDDEFPRVFEGACRRLPSRRDRRTIESYGVNVCLAGPGGSLEAAIRMLMAGAAVVQAGGAGVFVDNSGRAHPSRDWIDLADSPDLWSVGMHVFGLCDAVIKRGDDDESACFDITSSMPVITREARLDFCCARRPRPFPRPAARCTTPTAAGVWIRCG